MELCNEITFIIPHRLQLPSKENKSLQPNYKERKHHSQTKVVKMNHANGRTDSTFEQLASSHFNGMTTFILAGSQSSLLHVKLCW